jgi:hypothetical protein
VATYIILIAVLAVALAVLIWRDGREVGREQQWVQLEKHLDEFRSNVRVQERRRLERETFND